MSEERHSRQVNILSVGRFTGSPSRWSSPTRPAAPQRPWSRCRLKQECLRPKASSYSTNMGSRRKCRTRPHQVEARTLAGAADGKDRDDARDSYAHRAPLDRYLTTVGEWVVFVPASLAHSPLPQI